MSKTPTEVLSKVLEKFENQLDKLIESFNAKTVNVSDEMRTLHTRTDVLETKIVPLLTAGMQTPVTTSGKTDVAGNVEIASRALIAVEKEKEEIKVRSLSVVVTGNSSSSVLADKELFETFCEEHLTVKPQVVHTRRVG